MKHGGTAKPWAQAELQMWWSGLLLGNGLAITMLIINGYCLLISLPISLLISDDRSSDVNGVLSNGFLAMVMVIA